MSTTRELARYAREYRPKFLRRDRTEEPRAILAEVRRFNSYMKAEYGNELSRAELGKLFTVMRSKFLGWSRDELQDALNKKRKKASNVSGQDLQKIIRQELMHMNKLSIYASKSKDRRLRKEGMREMSHLHDTKLSNFTSGKTNIRRAAPTRGKGFEGGDYRYIDQDDGMMYPRVAKGPRIQRRMLDGRPIYEEFFADGYSGGGYSDEEDYDEYQGGGYSDEDQQEEEEVYYSE